MLDLNKYFYFFMQELTGDIPVIEDEPEDDDPEIEDIQSVGEFNEEAFRYIVGYVQMKLKKRFPQPEVPDGIEHPGGWDEERGRGKLTIPNQDLIEICRDLNAQFQAFHGDTISKEPEPMETLLKKVLRRQEDNENYFYLCVPDVPQSSLFQ